MIVLTENGFTGIGETEQQAEIALLYASAYLPLEEGANKVATYGDLGSWNGREEESYQAYIDR